MAMNEEKRQTQSKDLAFAGTAVDCVANTRDSYLVLLPLIVPKRRHSGLKVFCACLFVSIAISANSQTAPQSAETARSRVSMADFGLVYPLSNDWVRATEMLRKKVQSDESPQTFDVLLTAVYVPKSGLSATNPSFPSSLTGSQQPTVERASKP